ncbi:alpha/beta hydrolase protein [Rhizophagus irregularis DAOM 181602=DAOM 197198]|uniref:Alpha/Beta hydrolase protein n=1 Tax=Rhizophagus irregularis (strain DAOM 181602 / DAOM 197198 / MUCL 43194) TaxID=747089 RepID=A0A2P4QMA3_RHIID|nr:Alpha/Beta hydrolase protein [Rhizophagus irregularis DAOM 181602=DAOM 197198]POG78772.1 Alpha/Beta hydrolase protein [Rhizophagus irregularis DAOM 181602=DAOM 197198]GBC51966.2 alpha/beta hydrolase protein [Rhizophagus irregularis DAOM 181602=DAOM 197198]|eukprot:XP_025185638.1 Alpha/Beta hydrolase protein [Rhizophagus irregularis DAOM 181602=DAOM 197198]
MQQQIISSSCKATPTKYMHNSFSHLLQHTLSFKLISLISLIFLSALIEAAPVPNTLGPITSIPNLQSFANYAAAAYIKAPLQNWDCGEICQKTKGTQLVKEFSNDVLNTRGYIATEPEKQLIIVAYRGTEPGSIKNYISDFVIYHDTWKPAPGTLVHHGFLNAWEQIQPQVTDDLLKLIQEKPDFRIGFMGHSLGGALATFSALDLINKAPELAKNEKLFLSTFGQPRMGDEKFAEFVDENLRAIRTVVHGDPIPRLPPPWPIPFIGSYKHFGKELYINNPDQDPDAFQECVAEDPNCSESVPFDSNEGDKNYDYSADPYFNYDPNYNYGGAMGVNDVGGAKGVNGTKEVKGTKGVNGVDRAKGYR